MEISTNFWNVESSWRGKELSRQAKVKIWMAEEEPKESWSVCFTEPLEDWASGGT